MKVEIKEIDFEHNDIYNLSIYPESGIYLVSYPFDKSLVFVSKKTGPVLSLMIDDIMTHSIQSSKVKKDNIDVKKDDPKENNHTGVTEETLLKLASILTHNTKPKDLDR